MAIVKCILSIEARRASKGSRIAPTALACASSFKQPYFSEAHNPMTSTLVLLPPPCPGCRGGRRLRLQRTFEAHGHADGVAHELLLEQIIHAEVRALEFNLAEKPAALITVWPGAF